MAINLLRFGLLLSYIFQEVSGKAFVQQNQLIRKYIISHSYQRKHAVMFPEPGQYWAAWAQYWPGTGT